MKIRFTNEELNLIETALMKAEAQTEGEIVPMVVSKCCTTGHARICTLLCGLTLIFGIELFYPPFWIFALLSLSIILISYWAGTLDVIERFFTPRGDQKKMVEARAFYEFYQNGVHLTHNKIGVLIFLSLFEKRAVILADQGIAQKLDASVWQNILTQLTQRAGQKDLTKALINAIESVGQILHSHFPEQAGARNELKNQLVIKD